jgi:HSP20 family protein
MTRRVWDPFQNEEFVREMNRILDAFGVRRGPHFRSVFLPGRSARAYPRMNLYEDPEVVRVEALAPGIDIESLDLSIKENVLTVSGEKKPLEGVKRDQYHRSERSTGKFKRTIDLETEIDPEQVTAEYENGILRITLPKAERARPKKISVSVK